LLLQLQALKFQLADLLDGLVQLQSLVRMLLLMPLLQILNQLLVFFLKRFDQSVLAMCHTFVLCRLVCIQIVGRFAAAAAGGPPRILCGSVLPVSRLQGGRLAGTGAAVVENMHLAAKGPFQFVYLS
jgi:hypothetical protein